MDDWSTSEPAKREPPQLPGSHQTRRTTIAFLTDHPDSVGDGYATVLRDALDAACRMLDLNLLVIVGHSLQDPSPNGKQHNRVYDWVRSESVDGIILQAASLATFGGADAVIRLSQRYLSIPMCSIGLEIEGIPSVVIDNRLAMRRVVEHAIREHGCKRPLFLGGPSMNHEAQDRLAAFQEVLAEHEIAANSQYIVCGDFTRHGAVEAINGVIAEGLKFDAVIAANDHMALGALSVLRKVGRRVPHDVLVTGFDDVHEIGLANPPVTTARQPLRAMAELGLRLVFEQLEGNRVELLYKLPTEIVIRRSCGCGSRTLPNETRSVPPPEMSLANYFEQNLGRLARIVEQTLFDGYNPLASERVRCLIVGLQSEMKGSTHAFLDALEDVLVMLGTDTRRYQLLGEAISRLRVELGPFTTSELENLWHEARCNIMLASMRSLLSQRMDIVDMFERTVHSADQFATAIRDFPQPEALVKLDLVFKTAFVSRLVASDRDEFEPILFIIEGRSQRPPVASFPAHHFLPGGSYPDNRRHSSVVFPLVQEQAVIGIAVFELSTLTKGYEIVCEQLATAINNLNLHEQVLKTTTLHERSIQERLATAQRMQSLSLLAGGVAHDLNNALGPIVALPDVILTNLDAALGGDAQAISELRADVEAIKVASLRASRTIKDLLTLGRQGQTEKVQVDLNLVVLDSLPSSSARFSAEDDRPVTLAIDSHHEPLWINGSEAHLVRAINNLIRNAVEAIPGRGSVSIKTSIVTVNSPMPAFETIEPGDYAIVSVTDTGSGIVESDMGQVFEPFFSKKKLGDESGTGLGLAIVHGVVKEHGGYVDVQSRVGEGTTFTLYFPRSRTGTLANRFRSSPLPLRHARILVVDDELVQLRTSRRILSSLGYSVDTCGSGAEALAQIDSAIGAAPHIDQMQAASPYDLVIMDMVLHEDQDGLEILDAIRELVPGQRAIIASGHAPNERIQRALAAGLLWLAKPYTKNELERIVRRALAQSAIPAPLPLGV
jgi:DNA-binding LacI/PurR family transcriptional regulator/signal transduction histidine kinase/CheY-like chemotaxis protein